MLALFIICFTVAFIVLTADYKTESNRWLTFILILICVAAFSVEWEDTFIPYIAKIKDISTYTRRNLMMVNAILTTIPQYLAPYAFLMYTISYAGIVERKHIYKNIIIFLLLVPVIYSFFALPLKPNTWRTFDEAKTYFTILSFWSIPYLFWGVCILFFAVMKEKNFRIKLQKNSPFLLFYQ